MSDTAHGRVWFVTGASRGLGLEIARAALERGDRVVATARDPRTLAETLPDGVTPVRLDVRDETQVRAAVAAAVEAYGRIDVVVNNAGFGMVGGVEEVSDKEARGIFDTNVFGVLNVIRGVLPMLRAQRSGHVINISSASGFTAIGGAGLYGATKFAVEAISEALHQEVGELGIAVTVVEPGTFRTDAVASMRWSERVIDDYAGTVGVRRTVLSQAEAADQRGAPAKAAQAIVDLTRTAEPPLRLQLGPDAVRRVEAKLAHVTEELNAWGRSRRAPIMMRWTHPTEPEFSELAATLSPVGVTHFCKFGEFRREGRSN